MIFMKEFSLKDKICIVTGANSGLGKATTQQLVERDAYVVMVVRNEVKGIKALEEIKKKTRKDSMEIMICDFSSQKSILEFVNVFKKKFKRLDVLINNHGLVNQNRDLTDDGLEKTFAVNYLAFFHLTKLLEDLLITSAPSRVINVSSGAYMAIKKWPLDDYNWDRRKFSVFGAYAESKLYVNMFSYYLAEQLKNKGVTVNAYSPGFTRTNFGSGSWLMKMSMLIAYPFGKSPLKASKTAIYLASSPIIENKTGLYFEKLKEKETNPLTHNKTYQEDLWNLSMKLTNLE